ncbi:leucine-rich repeat domain-containing protein [Flavobacterium ginsenosidimutans]|uniref:Internalin n=1 Tax=Flavobacterium ginsenosidimutans TaxID=687844 RepID=A0ABZ2Q5G3_9FLAO|nr:hypothetical protein [Flavobacterium ginsenosidimutans]KAF2326452.1 hypothetical protein DM444_21405 [Flavobacterium ginsenosidimutans]
MKKYTYNSSINMYEIDPRFLEEGILKAQKKSFDSIRIKAFADDCDFKCHLDLLPLKDKKFIKKLIIDDSFKLQSVKNIEAIYSLQELIDFTIALPINIDFKELTQLEKLYLNNESYQNLSSLINLKELYFSRYSKENCCELSKLKELTFLRLDNSKNLISLDGIEELANLKWIWLMRNSNLYNANNLAQLKKLERLDIEGSKKLIDYSFLNNNQSIKKTLISDLDSLDFVRNMNALENINFWNCETGDLSPLLECPTLKEVSFHPQKKYYSHKKDEINNILIERNKI